MYRRHFFLAVDEFWLEVSQCFQHDASDLHLTIYKDGKLSFLAINPAFFINSECREAVLAVNSIPRNMSIEIRNGGRQSRTIDDQ
jgi:hypothetical protein